MKTIPPEILLEAYARGVFPMAEQGEILWFSPESRGLIPLDERFHIPHGLAKSLKRKPFEIRWDTAFREVMLGCAARKETWIDEAILASDRVVVLGNGVIKRDFPVSLPRPRSDLTKAGGDFARLRNEIRLSISNS